MEVIRLIEYAKVIKGKQYLNWSTWKHFIMSDKYSEIINLKECPIEFSIDGFNYINPDGLTWLLIVGKLLGRNNDILLTLPKNEMQIKMIKSIKFYEIARNIFSIKNPYVMDEINIYKNLKGIKAYRISNDTYLELLEDINSYTNSVIFSRDLLGIVPRGEVESRYLNKYERVIIELSDNAIEHSQVDENTGEGYIIMQASNIKMNLSIFDIGVGFLYNLKNNSINDKEAIKNAFLYGYYNRCDKKNITEVKGSGIFEVIKFIRKIGGSILVRSGMAEGYMEIKGSNIRYEKEKDEDNDVKYLIENNLSLNKYDLPYIPGVQYRILLNMNIIKHL